MSRIVSALALTAFLSAGIVILGKARAASPDKADVVTFTPIRTPKGEAIQVTVGDIAFEVPSLELKRNDNIKLLVIANNGELGTILPFDSAVPRRVEDLRAIAVRGKSYSLSIRQPPSSAYFHQAAR